MLASVGFGRNLRCGGMTPRTGVTDSRCFDRKGGRHPTTVTAAGSIPSSSCAPAAPKKLRTEPIREQHCQGWAQPSLGHWGLQVLGSMLPCTLHCRASLSSPCRLLPPHLRLPQRRGNVVGIPLVPLSSGTADLACGARIWQAGHSRKVQTSVAQPQLGCNRHL